MTWIAPGFLVAAAVASLAVVALHLIMHRLPPPAPFPTARFIPAGAARAARRALRPDDVPLLLLRVATILLAGAALARPVPDPERRASARIVLLDRSRAVLDHTDARDSAMAQLEPGDLLIVFDSAARLTTTEAESLRVDRDVVAAQTTRSRGNLTAALVAAIHAAPALRRVADSIELIVISPFALEELDAATARVRTLWPGRIRLVRLAGDTAAASGASPPSILVRAAADDAVAAGASLASAASSERAVRVVRTGPTPADSAWARAGNVLVHWPAGRGRSARTPTGERRGLPPADPASDDAGKLPNTARASDGASNLLAADTIGAVVAQGAVVIAPFERPSRHAMSSAPGVSPVAWWADGEVAATERATGGGCIRDIAIEVPQVGDLVLRAPFRDLLRALAAPCGGLVHRGALPDDALTALAGEGGLMAASALPAVDAPSALAPWLLAGALLLAAAEPIVRRRKAEG